MPQTDLSIADATAAERRLTKALLDMIERRERMAQRLASYQSQVASDQAELAKIDGDLLPALEDVFAGRGFASIDGVELLRNETTGKPNGLRFTHP